MAQSPAVGTGPAGRGDIPPRAPAWPAAPACPPAGIQFSSRPPLGAGQPVGSEGHRPSTSGNPAFCGILRLRRALSPKEAMLVSARIGSVHASVTKYHSLAGLSDGDLCLAAPEAGKSRVVGRADWASGAWTRFQVADRRLFESPCVGESGGQKQGVRLTSSPCPNTTTVGSGFQHTDLGVG